MGAKAPSVKRYVVRLSAEERQQLEAMIRKGKSPAQRLLKARILLKADVSEDGEGWSDSRIIEALETSVSMVYRVRKQLVEEGLEAVLSRKAPASPAVPRIFDGEREARLIAWPAPSRPRDTRAGACACWRARWWNSASSRPRDPDRPLVCLDETSKQLVAESRSPMAVRPGSPARVDYEYTRNGVANLFMMFAPLEGWRQVKVTDRRTAIDYAHVLRDLADVHFAQAKTIILVQDNLNTHAAASLYEAFPAAEARRLVERFEWHYTPKHGSWLDLAESELGAPRNVSTAASPTSRQSSPRSPPGSTIETTITPSPSGTLRPKTPALNLTDCTLRYD